jgi:hypothetical protein
MPDMDGYRMASRFIDAAGLVDSDEYASIPVFVSRETFDRWRDCVRCVSAFEVKWFQLTLVLLCSVVVHIMEVPGIWQAFRRRPFVGTQHC